MLLGQNESVEKVTISTYHRRPYETYHCDAWYGNVVQYLEQSFFIIALVTSSYLLSSCQKAKLLNCDETFHDDVLFRT